MKGSEAGRDPGASAEWEADLPEQKAAPEIETLGIRCQGCGQGFRVAVLPFHPRIAKAKCPMCSHVSEVATRPEAMDVVKEMFDHNHDADQVAKHPKEYSKNLRSSSRIVQTKHGRVALID